MQLRSLLFASALLLAFGAAGQIECDAIGRERTFLRYLILNVLLTLAVCMGTFALVRALRRDKRVCRVLSRALGAVFLLYALTLSAGFVRNTGNYGAVYSAGWWIGYVDKLEDERYLWGLTHWFGAGEPYYLYDVSVTKTPAATEADAKREPCHTALDERARAAEVYDG